MTINSEQIIKKSWQYTEKICVERSGLRLLTVAALIVIIYYRVEKLMPIPEESII